MVRSTAVSEAREPKNGSTNQNRALNFVPKCTCLHRKGSWHSCMYQVSFLCRQWTGRSARCCRQTFDHRTKRTVHIDCRAEFNSSLQSEVSPSFTFLGLVVFMFLYIGSSVQSSLEQKRLMSQEVERRCHNFTRFRNPRPGNARWWIHWVHRCQLHNWLPSFLTVRVTAERPARVTLKSSLSQNAPKPIQLDGWLSSLDADQWFLGDLP